MERAAALPEAHRVRPRLNMLAQADCERIHAAACEILQTTGVEVYHTAAVQLLRKAGAAVDGERVRIGPQLIDRALSSAPASFNLYHTGSDRVAIRLDGAGVYFGPGSDTLRYLDPRSGVRRDFQVADVADCIRVCDALPEIDFVMSIGIPRDVPPPMAYRAQFAAMLRNTRKPIVFVCDDLADITAITAMANAAAGGENLRRQFPNLLLYSEPTSPLLHSTEATDKLLFCAAHGIPVTHSPAPMMGGTAPITVAGAVALGNAEVLSSLVLHQLQNPGAPFLYGHGVHHLDMKEMISVYGAPEFQLARVLAAEMGRFYNLPVWGYAGHSDSKLPDEQAAADAQFAVMTALLARTNLNHDVGYLESGLTGSPEMIVLTSEIISQTRRFAAGVRLDDEALAVDVVGAVGPGGEFLSHDHSMAHWRELWLPQLFDRRRLEPWEAAGARDTRARVRQRTVAILDDHQPTMLSATVDAAIERVL